MVFHKYKLIVIGVPKNASSSIFDALKNRTDAQHGHETIIDTYNNHDSDLVELYTSLAVVRNPYDRFFSACHQIRRDEKENRNLSVSEIIIQEIFPNEGNFMNDVFIPQHHYVSIGGKVLIDKILRYENLEKEWREFVDEFNKTAQFPITKFLPRSNATAEKIPWEEEIKVLTQDELDLINNMYTRDFKMFGYEKKQKV